MTADTPAAAPITAERENLLARIDLELSDFRREGSWYVCADRDPNDLDGAIAVDDAMRIARATLSAPVAFDIWWQREVESNGGVPPGADYRHWAKKGYDAAPVAAPPADPLLGQALAALVRYANACDADAKTVAVIQALEARIDAAPVFHLRSFGDVTADELERLTVAQPAPAAPSELHEDALLAFNQCRAVAHMARSLAEVHDARAAIVAQSKGAPIEVIGESTAEIMEWLGDTLSNMDAVAEDDAWLDPVFEAAHARWLSAAPAAQPADSAMDSERLEWLEQQGDGGVHVDRFTPDGKTTYILRDGAWGKSLGYGPTLREAIDRARTLSAASNKDR